MLCNTPLHSAVWCSWLGCQSLHCVTLLSCSFAFAVSWVMIWCHFVDGYCFWGTCCLNFMPQSLSWNTINHLPSKYHTQGDHSLSFLKASNLNLFITFSKTMRPVLYPGGLKEKILLGLRICKCC
jgi:hypothetical protein